ncbi:AAA family ATPase [Desulfomicrobium escambiense]|uniref:AAA family ATPase n=1 Tax=Desulfomicrobium escambiense TaxID=29503 RepID=UPI000409C3A1|nr:AAA family ATPase [Desulfomicrobium escambiense]
MSNAETTIFWTYGAADSASEELERDLINRKTQDPLTLLPMLKVFHPNGHLEGNVFCSDWLRVFLGEGQCGFWTMKRPGEKSTPMDGRLAQIAGTMSFESYGCRHLGFIKNMAYKELARRGNVSTSKAERYKYGYKPGCSRVHSFDKSMLDRTPREKNPVQDHGFTLKSVYFYPTLDNKVTFCTCYFQSPEGEIEKLPLTLWKTASGRFIFDWLHPLDPFPLYRWDLLYNDKRPVIICENEAQVEYLREKHSWLLKSVGLTTWSGGESTTIDGTDWGALNGRLVVIIVSPGAEGYKRANKLYRAMKRLGVGPIGFLMPRARLQADQTSASAMLSALDEDITESLLQKNEVADRAEFVKDAKERFGLDFDPDFVASAISGSELVALPLSDAEVVLGPMIMKGDRVLVYAHRGSGKTWLICFIAVACVSGGSLFVGRLEAPRPLRVLVIDGEMGGRELQKRYSMIFKAMGTPEHLQDNLRIIAARIQGREIQLETPEERERFKEDIAWADVIIADSMFCLFPNAMGSQLDGARGFNEFMRANSLQGKTTIVVDHTGKNKRNSYGTIGKELGLELVLKLEKVKNQELFRLSVEKHRNLGSKDVQPIEFMLNVDEDAGIAELKSLSEMEEDTDSEGKDVPCMTRKDMPSSGGDCDAGRMPSVSTDCHDAPIKLDDQNSKIIAARTENPNLSVRKLASIVGVSKGTAHNRLKKLQQAGLLRPKGASVEEGEFGVDDDEA